jgi:hypothetical protein
MNKSDELVLVFTGTEVIIDHIKAELEAKGIGSIVKDEFRMGLEAGFGGESPSAIDLYVLASEEEKAREVIKDITA